jgi:hypothetical protein
VAWKLFLLRRESVRLSRWEGDANRGSEDQILSNPKFQRN